MVRTCLETLERLLAQRAPRVLSRAGLRPPASSAECAALAAVVGLGRLPIEVEELLRWHDGQDGSESILAESADLGGWRLMPVQTIAANLARLRGAERWRPSFLPLLESGGGDMCGVDVETGTVWTWWHEEEPEDVVARSLEELFSNHLEAWTWELRGSTPLR